MNAIRVSNGRFDLARSAEVERAYTASEAALREGIERLPGLVHFYAGIDRETGTVVNASVWSSVDAAKQLNTFQPMLDQKPIMEAVGVRFEPIANHDVIWEIG